MPPKKSARTIAAEERAAREAAAANEPLTTEPGTVTLRMFDAKPRINVIKKMIGIVPKGTGETDAPVWLRTVEGGLRMTYAHFGYGVDFTIPATIGEGVQLNHSIPFEVLRNLNPSGLVTFKLLEGDALGIQLGGLRINALLDPPDNVERQIPTFLSDCYDQFSMTDEQFSTLLRQVIFKSTDISVRGSGLPVQIKSDPAAGTYHIVARDSAFGIIKSMSATIEADINVTLSHQFLSVVNEALRKDGVAAFAFSEDMTSCRASIPGVCTVWSPVPMFEEHDLLSWRDETVRTETVKAQATIGFEDLMSALGDITPHFKLDDQTNNVTITFDDTGYQGIKITFTSNRLAAGKKIPCERTGEVLENDIVTDGARMFAFLECGRDKTNRPATVKLLGNYMFINLVDMNLEFILPLR